MKSATHLGVVLLSTMHELQLCVVLNIQLSEEHKILKVFPVPVGDSNIPTPPSISYKFQAFLQNSVCISNLGAVFPCFLHCFTETLILKILLLHEQVKTYRYLLVAALQNSTMVDIIEDRYSFFVLKLIIKYKFLKTT
ncbi:hypothetical protein HWI79_3013 [Cryptosporidium felis]|nr:hypothetical protein HWI79_3013 [Cryptosporidium felis]